MQDQRRRGERGNALDQAADAAIATVLARLPPDRQIAVARRIGVELAEVLTKAPPFPGREVEDMAMRARLAAAFRVKLDEGGSGRAG